MECVESIRGPGRLYTPTGRACDGTIAGSPLAVRGSSFWPAGTVPAARGIGEVCPLRDRERGLTTVSVIMIKPTDVTGLGPAGIIAFERRVILPDPTVRAYIWSGERADSSVLPRSGRPRGARWGAVMIGPKGSLPAGSRWRAAEED